ncbi:hypothetical protein Tco_0031076 [Tanacetum coccineum]
MEWVLCVQWLRFAVQGLGLGLQSLHSLCQLHTNGLLKLIEGPFGLHSLHSYTIGLSRPIRWVKIASNSILQFRLRLWALMPMFRICYGGKKFPPILLHRMRVHDSCAGVFGYSEDDCLLPLSFRDVCEMESLQLIDLSNEDDCLLPLSLRDVCEMDSLQLIDLYKEDDCLLPLSLRDSVEDVKLSCAVPKKITEPDSTNDLLVPINRSWNWHSNKWLWNIEQEKLEQDPLCPVLLTNEEMTLINKGFAEANSNQPSYGTLNDGRPHQVSGQNQTLSDSDGFHLETLESDLPKYVNPDIHIKNKAKKGLKDDIATDHSKATIDKEKRQDGCKNQEESRRLTLRKSLDWDSAFIPSAGSHQDQISSKSGDLPLGALEAELFKDVHHSVESPSSGLSKRTRRKINYRNTKPTTISSGTSPASHFHVAISESDFQSPPHPPCHNFGERKFKKQCSTRFSIGNITPSGLRMPSPRIGFFDEDLTCHNSCFCRFPFS